MREKLRRLLAHSALLGLATFGGGIAEAESAPPSAVRQLRVLVWNPHAWQGGGLRFLASLTAAMARQESVELVRVAIPSRLIGSQFLPHETALETFEVKPSSLDRFAFRFSGPSWLERDSRILGIRGTRRVKRSVTRYVQSRARAKEFKQFRAAARDCNIVYAFWPQFSRYHPAEQPVVCTYHDTTLIDFPEILGSFRTREVLEESRQWLEHASFVVTGSEATKRNVTRIFGERCERAIVIHGNVAPTVARNSVHLSPGLRERLPERFIVCAAGLSSHKNHENLLAAWARFPQREAVPLVLFGGRTEALDVEGRKEPEGDWLTERLRGLITKTGLKPWRDFYPLGYVDDGDVMGLIRRAEAMIMPTLAEGGGSLPVEEALSLGVPVMCSDIPVLREILDGRNASIAWFDPQSPASIAAALTTLFENYPALKASATRASREAGLAWDDVAAQYVGVFQRAVKETTRSAGRRAGLNKKGDQTPP